MSDEPGGPHGRRRKSNDDTDLGFELPPLPSMGGADDAAPATRADGLSFPPIGPATIGNAMRGPITLANAGHHDSDDDTGKTLTVDPRYSSPQVLAQGGMGMVITCIDSRLNREVAMKLIRRDRLGDAQTRARFLREAQVHAQLEHPNIVPVHDLVERDGSDTFFTMKLVRGRSLAALIRDLRADIVDGRGDAAFRLGDRLDVFRKVCDGISFAHSRGVIHRDLKPDNIMVGEFGEVQVMDWGLARLAGQTDVLAAQPAPKGRGIAPARPPAQQAIAPARPAAVPPPPPPPPPPPRRSGTGTRSAGAGSRGPGSGSRSRGSGSSKGATSSHTSDTAPVQLRDAAGDARSVDGDIMGTPQYMAPEQAAGSPVDARADVYALGAILYELLALSPAIESGLMFAVLHRVASGDFPPPSQRVANDAELAPHGVRVPAELEAVVLKAMAKRPAQRYRSVAELRRDVGDYLDGRMVAAVRYSVWQRARRFVARNRVTVLVAALVMLMAAGGIVATFIAAGQARDEVLNRMRAGLDAAVAASATIEQDLSAGQWQRVVESVAAFETEHAGRLAALADNDVVQSDHPDWLDLARATRGRATAMRDDALRRWALSELQALPAPDVAAAADGNPRSAALAEASFERFRPWLQRAPAASLPVADFAFWLARAAAATADRRMAAFDRPPTTAQWNAFRDAEAKMVSWVSRGWLAQPDAEATGRGFLLIAERELGRINGKPMLESVILRLHRAWSVFGERAPALRPRVLLRLATALIGLPVGDATPFAPDVPAYRMALRCLLQLIDPAGNVLPQAATWMESWPPAERDEWIELTRQCLIIARRIAGPATSGGWAPWPLDERMGWSLQEHEMQLATFSTPGPGFDPPAVSIVQRVPYSTLFNTAPDATITILNSTVGRRPDGKWSLGARLVVNGANMLAWAPDLGRPGGGSFCQPLDGRWFAKFACGDMDGDGRLDVIVGANLESGWEYAGDVAVMSQQPDGRFAAPVPVRTPDLEQPQARSFVLAVTVADLDRDGRCELVVSRTRFNHYNTVVFRFDARGRYRQTDSLLTGEAVSVAVTGGPETLLVLDGYANSSQRRQYDAMGQPFTLGHHLYRYRNEHLDELPIPWTTVGEWNRLGEGVSITTVRDLGESEAHYINHPVAMLSVLGGSWACNRWMLYRGADLAHPIAAHEWHVGTVWHPVTFEIGQTGAGLARRLRDVDLELVMREGPPARGADESRGSEVVTLATTLLAFGSPQAATSVLRERLAAGSLDPAVELQLLGLQLRSLQASGDIAGVGEFARGLSVRSALVPLLLDAAATILRESGQWEQLITLLEPWFNDRWLPDLDHARIGEQLLPMREAARIFAARGIEVRGTQVTVNGEPAGSLAEHFLTNDISQVRQMPGPGGAAGSANGPWTVRTSGARLFGAGGTALMSDVPTVQADGDGARLVGRELVCSGVPVIVDEGPWRMAFDFEIPGGFWDSWYRFGLLAVSPGGISFGTSWSFHLRGELRDDAIEPQFPGLPLLDALIGRKLRLEAEFVPSIGLHRTTLSDATTGDVLGVHPATVGRNYMAMPSIGTRWRVLGLLGEGNWRSEMIIHSIQLRGAVRLWPMVEPDRSRFASGAEGDAAWQSAHDTWMRGQRELPSSLTLQTMSAAARAHLAGRRQEAATILQGLASRLMQGPQPADPAAQAERAELTNCLLLDAAWELGWRDATAFSSQLLALLQSAGQQGPDALEGFVQLIERWLLLRGQWPPEPGLWEGAGGALMTAILRPTTDNVAPLIADRMNRTPVDYTQCRNLAMAAWLAVRVPAQQAFLQDALAAITAASVDNPYLQPVRLWYVHLTGAAASRGALNDDSRRARLAVLFEFHRRAEALGASRAGDDAWFRERTVMPLVTHQRGVHTTREEAVNGSRAACQRLGVLKAPQ